jgi:hypothetical protein
MTTYGLQSQLQLLSFKFSFASSVSEREHRDIVVHGERRGQPEFKEERHLNIKYFEQNNK